MTANPAHVRYYVQALCRHAKTGVIGAIGAFVIARFAAGFKPEPSSLVDEAAQLLAGLAAQGCQIAGMLTAGQQREKRTAAARFKKSLVRVTCLLEIYVLEIYFLEKKLANQKNGAGSTVKNSPVWRGKRKHPHLRPHARRGRRARSLGPHCQTKGRIASRLRPR